MHPIEVKQAKEIILVSDDVHASRRVCRDVLGLAMPAASDRLNLARVGSQYLGVSQAGTMAHPGFTGRVHLGLEIAPADFERRGPPAASGHRRGRSRPAARGHGHP